MDIVKTETSFAVLLDHAPKANGFGSMNVTVNQTSNGKENSMLDYWVDYAGSTANANEEVTEGKPVRYFIREGEDILTDRELKAEWDSHKGDPDFTATETFEEYLEMCQWYNNGSLTEIPSSDMQIVRVTETETTEDGVEVVDTYKDYIFRVRQIASNPEAILSNGTISVTLLDGYVVEQKGRDGFHRPSRWTWKKGEGLRWQH